MITAAINLADLYSLNGKLDRSIPLLEDVLNGTRDKSRPDHPGMPADRLLGISAILGEAYEQAGRLAKAELLYREALETARRQHKEASSDFTYVQICLARNLCARKRYAEAEPLIREGLKFREQHEPDGWTTFYAKHMLGGSLLGQNKFDEAEPLLLSSYEGLKQREETILPIVRKARLTEAIERLVQLYEAWGKREKAAVWRARLGLSDLPADVFARP
jgi:tetratricopeptide (TPR) repeat protein